MGGFPTLRGICLKRSKSLSVIIYRPPIFWPSLPLLQRACTRRVVSCNSAAACSVVSNILPNLLKIAGVPIVVANVAGSCAGVKSYFSARLNRLQMFYSRFAGIVAAIVADGKTKLIYDFAGMVDFGLKFGIKHWLSP